MSFHRHAQCLAALRAPRRAGGAFLGLEKTGSAGFGLVARAAIAGRPKRGAT